MHHFGIQRDFAFRVPDCNIRVGPNGDGTLAGIQAVQLCSRGRGQVDETLQIDPAFANPFGKQQRHAGFDTR